MTDTEKQPYNDGHTHEALHAAHMCISIWNDFVTESRCADEFQAIKDACDRAEEAMADAYMAIGQKFAEIP